MAAIQDKGHITIDGFLFVLAKQIRTERHVYGREEAAHFVNKFSSGDPNYRDSTFFPHWVQNNWLNGFDQEKFNDGGKFYRSSQVDPTNQEKLQLQKAIGSVGTISGEAKCFGQRSSSATNWWNANYGYRKQLTITAPSSAALPAGYPIQLTEDTGALVTAGKLRSDRKDLRIVYFNGSTWVDLMRHYVGASETYFATQAQISASQTDNNYYLYYGYSSESTTKEPAETTDSEWTSVYGMYGTTPDSNTLAIWLAESIYTTTVYDRKNAYDMTTVSVGGDNIKFGLGLLFSDSPGLNNRAYYTDTGDAFNVGNVTVEAWIKTPSSLSGNQVLLGRFDGSFNYQWLLRLNGTSIEMCIDSASSGATASGGTLSTNTVYHVAGTFDGTNVKVYLNGTQVGLTARAGNLTSMTSTTLWMGRKGAGGGAQDDFQGQIAAIRVSNVARTSFPYVFSSEPTYTADTELAQASASSSGTFEVYAGSSDGSIWQWDGSTTFTEVFNTRRLQWFDTIANKDTDLVVGDTGGTETAQAQSFQLATASKVKGVQIYIKKAVGTPQDLIVRIETNSSTVPSGTLADANLTVTIPVADISSSYGWHTVEFASASSAVLSATTTYWIVLKTAAGSNDNNYNIGADGSSPSYSSGNVATSTNGGSTWSADSAKDILFRLLAEATSVNQAAQVTLGGNTKLWFATGDPENTGQNNARLYTYNGTTWTLEKTFTGNGSSAALSLQVYNSNLYCGLAPTALIMKSTDGVAANWTTSKDIDQPDNPGFVWDMEVYNGRLYACGGHPEFVSTSNSQGFLFSYDDYQWNFVYDFSFTVIKSLAVFDNLLFLGSVDKKVFVYNTASMDKLLELPWDLSVNQMTVYDDKLIMATGATNSLTGEEAVFMFDRNGFHKAYLASSTGFNAVFVARNQLLIGGTTTTIYKTQSTYVASGTLQMSYFEASLPSIDKMWRSLALLYESLPSGCSILAEYKTDESDSSWTTIGTANTVGSTYASFDFGVAFYSKKLTIRLTLATTDNTNTPKLKVVDVKYVLSPDFKYLWKMSLACPDNIVWLDGSEPITTTTATISAGATSITVGDTSGFPTKGRGTIVDSSDDEFTWTGKTATTLTGIPASGDGSVTAHSTTGLTVKITGANLHKQILTLKQTKSLFTFVDIDGLSYTVLFHQYQADNFVVNQESGLENNVPITLLES